jgi:UDP-N-acetylmuramoyl-L-alanyl-D-glutamate--2,6-diaminopimelate ligase
MIAMKAKDDTPHSLRELLDEIVEISVANDRAVNGLTVDSRQVHAGDLFIAIPGTLADGRTYISDAIARGATAVLREAGGDYDFDSSPVPIFSCKDLRTRVGIIADRFFGSPSSKLLVIGVTGTNGKTTCTHLLAQVLGHAQKRCALIGTVGAGFPGTLEAMALTTPDAISVHGLLARFLREGATHVCVEVSSHALEQGRSVGVAFDLAIFTNLSRDHLDYHGSIDSYAEAKAHLFNVDGLKRAAINQDDPFGRTLLQRVQGKLDVVSFGVDGGDVCAQEIRPLQDGLELRATTPLGEITLHCPLFGRFNAVNVLAVLAALLSCGISLEQAREGLSRIRPVAGRVERFGGENGQPLAVVDYAHTPDALEQVLRALREHTQGRLYCVFGCGGDRDRGKRPEMGRVAERLADKVVLTDDNPRTESGDRIVAEIAAGMNAKPCIVRNRASAIRTAIAEANASDIVLIAGKGHEEYQQVGDRRMPYSDRETVRTILGAVA